MTLAGFTFFFLLSLRDVVDRIPRLLILLNVRKTELLPRVSNGICDQYAHGSDFTHLVESSS